MITYQKYNPSARLSKYIKYFYFLEHGGNHQNASLQRVTPDGCVELNFNLAGKSLQSISGNGKERVQAESYVVNRTSEHYFVKRKGYVKMLGICFYPWGFNAVTRVPMMEIKDMQVDAVDIVGQDVKWLYERLREAIDCNEMILLVEDYLLKRIEEDRVDKLVMQSALEMQRNPFIPVLGVADRYSVSHRRLEQRFKSALGISPKYFNKINRFQRSLAQLKKGNTQDVVFRQGYYDQAHFIKEFKHFSGLSPEKYLNENHSLNDLVTKWGST